MWTAEFSIETKASKKSIWHLWSDLPNWNNWDKEVKSSQIFGPFEKDSWGKLKPIKGPATKFEIVECTPFKSFTTRSFLPFCKMDFIHEIEELPSAIKVTHKVLMSGPLTFVFSKLIAINIEKGLPKAVVSLIKNAEENDLHGK